MLWLGIMALWLGIVGCRSQTTPSPTPTSTATVAASRVATATSTETAIMTVTATTTAVATPMATRIPTATATDVASFFPTNVAAKGATTTPMENSVYLPAVVGPAAPTATQTPSPSPTPTATRTPTPTPTPLPPAVEKPDLGVQVHLFGVDIDHVLGLARGTGAGWVKQQVEWTNLEYAPGEYDWRELDKIVEKSVGYGFKLLLSVNHAPTWTRAETIEYGPPHDLAEFGRFMGVLAARYAGKVSAYELWNEPNLRREWRGEDLDPALFVALIREGALAVRSVDPAAQIISGAPAVTGINDGETAVDDRLYLQGMVAAGVGQWIDGIGVHPYGFANPPHERSSDAVHTSTSHNNHPSFYFRDTLEDYRVILVNGGLSSTPLWATEFGWPSVDGMGAMDTTGWEYARAVTEKQQGEYIVQGFQMSAGLDWTGPMILWNLNIATIWGESRPESAYSLLRPDGDYRPAYLAVRLAEPE
jgi:hypothetical protein